MSPDPYEPHFRPPEKDDFSGPRTDIDSLMHPDPVPEPESIDVSVLESAPKKEAAKSDFQTLTEKDAPLKRRQRRAITDVFIDALTPVLIFLMVYAVIFFLLDVRYIYTAVHDANLRMVALFFVLGVVALNRVVARDGSEESILYFLCLAGTIGFYTLSTTRMYGVGSVARNFMNDDPYLATGLNMLVVAFIWWLVNRLTHECCVDINQTAGEEGMLTGTVRRYRKQKKEKPSPAGKKKRKEEDYILQMELQPFDPVEGYKPKHTTTPKKALDTTDKLSRKHPGVSIFYFSVPVMFIFAMGLRVVQHGGEMWVLAGHFYMGVYTVCALMLLLLTSLGGLRQYFRSRRVDIPKGLDVFWIGLGVIMILMVLLGALQLPKPELPPIAHVGEHEIDPWNRTSFDFQLQQVASTPAQILQETQFIDYLGKFVLALFALFLLYSLFRGFHVLLVEVLTKVSKYSPGMVRFFRFWERVLARFIHLPKPRTRRKRVRIQRSIATCTPYHNTLSQPEGSMTVRDQVEYAYQALSALAFDLGVPRKTGDTPYEFLDAFPPELSGLREEAEELTRLYVVAAYSELSIDESIYDRLRKFWLQYERIRRHLLR